jgi:transposase InsO family protein
MDEKAKQDIALFRVAVLGPLVGAQLEHGDLAEHCVAAAQRRWEWPDGTLVQLSARTVEGWFYAYRQHGLAGLMPKDRKDLGTSDVRGELADLVVRAKREKPRRSIRRIIRMLERAGKARKGELSRSAVHRLLARHKVSGRPKRGPSAERRSFLHELPGQLWIGDALHLCRPVVGPDGRVHKKAYLLTQLDCATRYITHSAFAFNEDAPAQEAGFKEALLIHGRPWAYYVDLGAAYVARSLRLICAELGVRLLHTGAGDAEAKGAIERWHRTWREEVEDELPEGPISLERLHDIHRAWLSREYHLRKHDTTGRAPGEHWLELVGHLRSLPQGKNLDEVFLHRAIRKVRKTGTIRWDNGLLEVVSPDLAGERVELRFNPVAPDVLPKVFVDNHFVCDTVPLDLHRNAHRKRRRDLGRADPRSEPTGIDPLEMLVQEHLRLTHLPAALNSKEAHETDSTED